MNKPNEHQTAPVHFMQKERLRAEAAIFAAQVGAHSAPCSSAVAMILRPYVTGFRIVVHRICPASSSMIAWP